MVAGDALTTTAEVAGILLAVPVLAGVVIVLYRILKRMHVVHEAIVGRPAAPGVEPVPSMIERFQGVDGHLKAQDVKIDAQGRAIRKIEMELHPNSGSSLRDQVDRAVEVSEAVARVTGVNLPPPKSKRR